jgi:hypothetical protein
MTPTYRFTTGPERWKVEAMKFDQLNRWQLYRAAEESWKRLRVFPTAEEAMRAVGAGDTGADTWDAASHDRSDFTPDKWSAESW